MSLFETEVITKTENKNDKDNKNVPIQKNANAGQIENKNKTSKIKDIEEENDNRKIRELKKIKTFNKIEENILNQFSENKLHHTIMLSGVYGIGKATFAYYLISQMILLKCQNEEEKNMHLEMLENNIHPDVYFLDLPFGENEIKIEYIRNFLDNWIYLKSTYGNKFVIIDDINSININGLNALLKTLEEPPNNTYFFIINHNISPVLETIYSRCNEIKLSISRKDCLSILNENYEDKTFEEIEFYTDISGCSIGFANILMSLDVKKIIESNKDKEISFMLNILYKEIDDKNKDLSRILKLSLLENIMLFLMNNFIKTNTKLDEKNIVIQNNTILKQFMDIKKFELPVMFF